MKTPIEIMFEYSGNTVPSVQLLLNNQQIDCTLSNIKNKYGHYCLKTVADLQEKNVLSTKVTGLSPGEYISLKEIFANNIRLGFVMFLCSTVNEAQSTMLTSDGKIDIELNTPIWEFFCIKTNSFNYKDYPLGSTN